MTPDPAIFADMVPDLVGKIIGIWIRIKGTVKITIKLHAKKDSSRAADPKLILCKSKLRFIKNKPI